MSKFYNIIKDEEGNATIDIFSTIGGWCGTDDFEFKQQLNAMEGKEITVRINSGGGDVFIGHNIYNMLKQSNKHIKVVVNGLAASIASVIAMAGDTIEMPSNAMMMIHNPSTFQDGTAEDMRKSAEVLDKVAETIKNVYTTRTGLSKDEITEMMDNETWLTAQEAKEKGFCDVITEEVVLDNSINNQFLNHYRNVPKALKNEDDTSDVEKKIAALEARIKKIEEKLNTEETEEQEDEPEKVQDSTGLSSFFNQKN